jgi:AsmA-like C-terminal region/AsmA family
MKSKILKIAGLIMLVLITFIGTAPWLFKGKITRLITAQVNKNLRAHVNFTAVDISLFRNFPKITIGLDNLQVTCVGEFQGDTLLTAKRFDIACGIGSLIYSDSIQIYSIRVNQPHIHALVHKNGHSNWNIIKSGTDPYEKMNSTSGFLTWNLQRYVIHNGYINYLDERTDMHIVAVNLEHEGKGNFGSDLFTLNTRTTADAVDFILGGAIPNRVTAKTSIELAFHVDNKSHTWSFNTDQVFLNELKLHTEGFFQWVNDSSYSMNIKFKAPSTKFKNILSMMPSVYRKDFASIESDGQVNFNGFIKGRYDDKHFPSYHTNLYIRDGSFKYPDLPVPVENINLGVQVDNPDGIEDHLTINISEAHTEINHDPLDLHLFVKNLKSKPFIDFGFVGKLDLGNIAKLMKLDSGTRLGGILTADIHAKGNIPVVENHRKEAFQAGGNFDLRDFSYASSAYPGGFALNELLMDFSPKNIIVNELKGKYFATHFEATGTLNNFFDFALRNKPLNATIALKADEFNLREWMRADDKDSAAASVHVQTPFIVPESIDFTIHAQADKFHFDNLDLQNLSGNLAISDQTIHLQQVRANGLDGDIIINGTYSTLESRENPEIALNYNVKGLDVQKTFLAFNAVRRIMPIAKFMSGNLNAHMSLNGRLHDDMTSDLLTLQGDGNVELLNGSMKDFGPLDKLAQLLEIVELKDIPLKDVKADFSFKNGRVVVSPFLMHTKDIDMGISGTHGFDQSIDYDVNLIVPRNQLGRKGSMFVKNVIVQAADKGIPVKLKDAVSMNVKMGGTINSPDVKPDMNAVVDNAASELKKEVNDFVNAKLDSSRQQLRNPPAVTKKPLYVQAAYKPKANLKAKKSTSHKHKNSARAGARKKHKKTGKNYSTSLKKEKSTASNNR